MKICMGCMEQYEDSLCVCPHCGFAEGTEPENPLHLEPGTILEDRYIVGKVIGFGGFGVTYIGWDALLEIKVAIKEYLPSEFSTRVLGQTEVTVFSGDKHEQFLDGMNRFVEEAKKLAKFHSMSGIVKIFDSFEFNNTAYIIMELLEGETLAELLKREKTISVEKTIEMITPVIESLSEVHKDGIIHRDIAPDNIFVTNSGKVKLIDFGAARYATTTHSRSLTVIIKPGYSPEEQYRSRGDQGTHSDVYAVAATMYKMITGQTPPDALERRAFFENKKKDILEPISKYVKDINENKENAILNALNVRIEDRTPDMEAFLKELTSTEPIKRNSGEIKKIDVLKWPLWAKITIPSMAALLIVFVALFSTGIIGFDANLRTEITIPDGQTRVPSVINNDYNAGETRLIDAKLLMEISGKEYSEKIVENLILSQDVNGGAVVPENTLIRVKVSSGKTLQMVPNVMGMPIETAQAELNKLDFAVVIFEEYDDVIAEGCVISQSFDPFSEVDDESEITLTVSKGRDSASTIKEAEIKMPNLVGISYNDAIKQLKELGLTMRVTAHEYNKDYDRDMIISQNIKANEKIKNTRVVDIAVSLGYEKTSIPDIVLKTEEKAISKLSGHGLKYKITYDESETIAKGLVISQSPVAGNEVTPETVITLIVSTGAKSFSMPNVVGMQEDEAVKTLSASGLSVSITYEQDDNKTEGDVIKQNVSTGASVKRGDSVVITVCTHSKVITVPNVVGKTQNEAEKAIKNAGLKSGVVKVNSDTIAKGIVISQTPKTGSGLKKNGVVIVNVSDGKNISNSIDNQTSSTTDGRNSSTVISYSNNYDNTGVVSNSNIPSSISEKTSNQTSSNAVNSNTSSIFFQKMMMRSIPIVFLVRM